MKKLMLPLVAVLVGGCATAPWTEKPGDVCDFEFPFSNDYDIINRTTFNWDDSYVTRGSTTGRSARRLPR